MLGLLWPRAGFRRTARYVAHRLARLPGTPHRIAAGFAAGAAVSFTPLIGFHFIGAALLALLLRGNLLASAIGTAVGNPWTFPFIWAWTYGLGRWILGHTRGMTTLPAHLSLIHIFDNFWSIFLPMLVGGIPTAILAWLIFYFPIRNLVKGYQSARRRRLAKRARRLAATPKRHEQSPPALEGKT